MVLDSGKPDIPSGNRNTENIFHPIDYFKELLFLFQATKGTNTDAVADAVTGADIDTKFKPSENFLEILAEKMLSKFKIQLEEKKARDLMAADLSQKCPLQAQFTQTDNNHEGNDSALGRNEPTLATVIKETIETVTPVPKLTTAATTTVPLAPAALTAVIATSAPATSTNRSATNVVTTPPISSQTDPNVATSAVTEASAYFATKETESAAPVEDPILAALTTDEKLTKVQPEDNLVLPEATRDLNPDATVTSTGSNPPNPDITEASTQTSFSPKPIVDDMENAGKFVTSVTTQTELMPLGELPFNHSFDFWAFSILIIAQF